MGKGLVFLGIGLLVIGLPLGTYYVSYLNNYNITITPALTSDVLFNIELLAGTGLLLSAFGAILLITSVLRGRRPG